MNRRLVQVNEGIKIGIWIGQNAGWLAADEKGHAI